MKHLTQVFAALVWRLGGPGLLLLGILDSSFLFAPLGNDLLVDVIFRRAGEKGLEKHLSKRRLAHVRSRVAKNAAWALALASVAPPPFPFTPFVMAAAALQYSRRKMLAVVGAARMVRFTALGVLALRFGRKILQWVESPVLQWALFGLIVVCIVGSVISVWGWIQRSRTRG